MKELLESTNKASEREAAQWFFLLTIMITLAAIVGSSTHRAMFLQETMKIPFLFLDLPLVGFYRVAPTIFLILHFYSLVQLRALYSKVSSVLDTGTELGSEDPLYITRVAKYLDSFAATQLLVIRRLERPALALQTMIWTTYVFAPVALLIFFQLQFLPYHDHETTWWHRILLLADLVIIGLLWLPMYSPRTRKNRIFFILIAMSIIIFSWFIATIPGEFQETEGNDPISRTRALLFDGPIDPVSLRPKSLFTRRLVLPHENFASLDDGDVIVSKLRSAILRGRDLRDAVLDRADLRGADLTGADLQGASLFAARLTRASLDRANLRGSTLMHAEMQGAWLELADMQGARIENAQLQGAWLHRTKLQGASLSGAQLQAAWLDQAELIGSCLNGATLDGAWLGNTKLQGASFDGSHMSGASIVRANIWKATGIPISSADIDLRERSEDPGTIQIDPDRRRSWPEIAAGWLEGISPIHQAVARTCLVRLLAPTGAENNLARPAAPTDFKQIRGSLQRIACAPIHAPHAARGIIRQLQSTLPFDRRDLGGETAALASSMLDSDKCRGVKGLDDNDRSTLARLASGQ